MSHSIFLNEQRRLRNGWWVAIFFLILAAFLFSVIFLSKQFKFDITILHQVFIITATSIICQLLRKKPLSNLWGIFNFVWLKELFVGVLIGMVLMLAPALFLFVFCGVTWHINTFASMQILSAVMLFVGVAVAEELLFRGFIFQRIIEGIGNWWAQLIVGGLFLLTHIGNPGMSGSIEVYASINIFLASIMFGLSFIRTKSLAMPIGIHFMANSVQGVLLGFGVSGLKQASILKPIFNGAPNWLTGGAFGLEASVPGMISLILLIIFLYRWKPVQVKSNVSQFEPVLPELKQKIFQTPIF